MEFANYPREEDPRYQYTTYWPISSSDQFTAPAYSLACAVPFQRSLLATQFAQYPNFLPQNVPLPISKQFGPLLHQRNVSVSSDERLNTPALTVSSLASTPQTAHSRLIAKSPQYLDHQQSLSALDYDSQSYQGSHQGSLGSSPTESYLDGYSSADSHTSSADSDNNWQFCDNQDNSEQHNLLHAGVIFNPSHTLHHQPMDVKVNMHEHDEIFDFMPNDLQYPLFQTPAMMQRTQHHPHDMKQQVFHVPHYQINPVDQSSPISQSNHYGSTTPPSPANYSDSSSDSSDSESIATSLATSPPHKLTAYKSPVVVKRKIHAARPQIKVVFGPAVAKNDNSARKVGCRRGPLQPAQRKRASEIRKVRACLRCRFLKKTCDPGAPCSGCQPHHARLWQVPCTRLDVRDLGYFMYDWKNDIQGKATLPDVIISGEQRTLYIGHGFDIVMPIDAYDVLVDHDKSLILNWTETHHRTPRDFAAKTECMSITSKGIDKDMLSEYLDRHLDNGWSRFVDHHFEGTPFLTEMLKTAHNYYLSTKLPIIRSALKLVLAYNLTLHISIVQGPVPDVTHMLGKINDPASKYHGKVAAPTLINHHLRQALSKIWRDIHKEVLEELSAMISGVYGRDKLKNWPTIFMVTYLVLSIWEQLRFDAIRRCRDMDEATKFCDELDGVPVGVVVGLFAAISQKLPSFKSWSTFEHHEILGSDAAACNVMEEVREHVLVHGML